MATSSQVPSNTVRANTARTDQDHASTVRAKGHLSGAALRLTRRGRLMFLGLPALLLVATIAAGALFVSASFFNQVQAGSTEAAGVQAEEMKVNAGDTLWSIASRAETNEDVQTVILQIAELNSLDSSELQPGEVIFVPTSGPQN